ncbi:MAG TPA: hypothetical protein VGM27_01185 [Acidobacteriaceae bacterium]|jgi:hypothetical protein
MMTVLFQLATRMRRFCLVAFLTALVSPAISGADASNRVATPIQHGFSSMYNLDFVTAHRDFDAWQKLHPEDPMGPACHAAAYLFTEFERLGVLESQLFTDDKRFDNRQKLSPDPQVKNMINAELDQADSLAAKALAKDANDANAQFAKVLSLGLRSDYAALVEKRNLVAIRYTKQGRALAEQLLKQNPNAYDAYLAVGVENYLSGIEPAPVRWLMAAGGVETDKAQGIHDLELTAAHGDLLAPFARLLLAVAALRDKEPAKACSLLSGLSSDYPHNPLYPREFSQNHCGT